jgi:hypothetical protein
VEIVGYLIPTRGRASPLIKYDRKRLTCNSWDGNTRVICLKVHLLHCCRIAMLFIWLCFWRTELLDCICFWRLNHCISKGTKFLISTLWKQITGTFLICSFIKSHFIPFFFLTAKFLINVDFMECYCIPYFGYSRYQYLSYTLWQKYIYLCLLFCFAAC